MFIATLDAKKVGNVVAFFRKQKGISQEVLSGLSVSQYLRRLFY